MLLMILLWMQQHLITWIPSEVENISVLKDAAASVYGARGGQGAIW